MHQFPPPTRRRRVGILVALAAAAATLVTTTGSGAGAASPANAAAAVADSTTPVIHPMPTKGHAHAGGAPGRWSGRKVVVTGSGIDQHGGPVMLGRTHVYAIWYGDWSAAAARQTLITGFLSAIAPSPWWRINTTYTDPQRRAVANDLTLAGQTVDAYSQGHRNLSDDAIKRVVTAAVDAGRVPSDPNGIYVVLTSADVTKSGFLSQYCGWHTHLSRQGVDLKYAFVGDPGAKGIRVCGAQTISPNGDAQGDAMVSVIAHELAETVSDPDLNAWYDTSGDENADKCAWTWGTTTKLPSGALTNVHLGARDYLVQQNWKNSGKGACALSL